MAGHVPHSVIRNRGSFQPFDLMLNENKIIARSAGPDRKFNTKDDLTNTDY
jgi:hypothetical protein